MAGRHRSDLLISSFSIRSCTARHFSASNSYTTHSALSQSQPIGSDPQDNWMLMLYGIVSQLSLRHSNLSKFDVTSGWSRTLAAWEPGCSQPSRARPQSPETCHVIHRCRSLASNPCKAALRHPYCSMTRSRYRQRFLFLLTFGGRSRSQNWVELQCKTRSFLQ